MLCKRAGVKIRLIDFDSVFLAESNIPQLEFVPVSADHT